VYSFYIIAVSIVCLFCFIYLVSLSIGVFVNVMRH